MVELDEKHYAATVYVISKEIPRKILLVPHKKFDKWMPPGEHKELLENSYESAIKRFPKR